MRSAKITDGVVTNVAVGLPSGYTECPDEVGIGWLYDGANFTAAIYVAPTVALAQEARRAAVNTLRDTKFSAGYTMSGKAWDANIHSVGSAMSRWHRHAASPPTNCTWIAIDNATVTLTWANFVLLASALGDYNDALVNQARTHKDAIDALGTVTLVDAYDITTGWPATS